MFESLSVRAVAFPPAWRVEPCAVCLAKLLFCFHGTCLVSKHF